MNDVKLTDFSPAQLQAMLTAIELLRKEREIGYFMSHAEDDINLIRVQVLTSIGMVAMREKTASN